MAASAQDVGVRPIRRIVTANKDGRSVVAEDGLSPHVMPIRGIAGHAVTDLWKTTASPAIPQSADACSVPVQLAPPECGTVFRIVEFPPDAQWMGQSDTRPPLRRWASLARTRC